MFIYYVTTVIIAFILYFIRHFMTNDINKNAFSSIVTSLFCAIVLCPLSVFTIAITVEDMLMTERPIRKLNFKKMMYNFVIFLPVLSFVLVVFLI